MDLNKEKELVNHPLKKERQQHEIIFGFEYFINLNLKVKCGFSTTRDFKPMVWLQYNTSSFIGFERSDWLHLLAYKEYIQLKLDNYNFVSPDTILDHPPLHEIKCDFKYKKGDGSCILILQQQGHIIEINHATWKNLLRISIFLTTFLCWNTILQKQIYHFYYNFFIPKCYTLKKNGIQLSEIDCIYEDEDVKIDLTRLAFEITKKMQKQIKKDVKMHSLLLRTKHINLKEETTI